MNKKISLNNLYLLIIGLLIFAILILINIVLNYKLDSQNINLNDVLIKTIPPLSGAFFSGIVAYLIFHLTKQKEINTKRVDSSNSLEIINQEIADNLDNAIALKQALSLSNPLSIAQIIEQEIKSDAEKDITKKLNVIESKFSTQIIDSLLSKLSNKDYLLIANEIKNIKMIIKSMTLLADKECGAENRKIIIENLLTITEKLNQANIKRSTTLATSTKENYHFISTFSLTEYSLRIGFILLIFTISLFLIFR